MTRRLPSLGALHAFEAAARLRSFNKAALELSVTATAISHRIRGLEQELGCRLFLRKTRVVELTAEGQTLLSAVSSSFQAMTAAVEQIRQPHRFRVTLTTTPAFAVKWLVPKLAVFQTEHPDIDLNIHASYQAVDLNAGTADLAIRYGHGHYAGTTATALLQDCFAPMASPSLAATLAPEVEQWPRIHFDWHNPLTEALSWDAWAKVAGVDPASLTAGIRYSEEAHAIQAAVSGQGVALLSLLLVEQELKMGLLQIVTETRLQGRDYHVLEPTQRIVSQATLDVKHWLLRQVPSLPAI